MKNKEESKYGKLLLDGRWKYIGWAEKKGSMTFENIYNHNTITLTTRQVNSVVEGKTTVSAITCRRINKGNNNTNKFWKNQKMKYAAKEEKQ